jgi:adenine specific DNA methylase Mod
MAEDASILVHVDWRTTHLIKIMLDEIFGPENAENEIIWFFPDTPGRTDNRFNRKHQSIHWYSKSENRTFNANNVREEILEASKVGNWQKLQERSLNNLGMNSLNRSRYEDAIQYFSESLTLSRQNPESKECGLHVVDGKLVRIKSA